MHVVYMFLFMLYVSITIESIKVTHYDWCLCFALVFYWPPFLLANIRKQLWFVSFWEAYFISFIGTFTWYFLHCFGTKINRVVTSKFDYWVFFVYSWWVLIKYLWYKRWTTSQLQYKSMNPEFTKITAWRWSQQSRRIHVTYIIISQINARVVLANKHTFFNLLFCINFGTNRTSSRHGVVTFSLSNPLI